MSNVSLYIYRTTLNALILFTFAVIIVIIIIIVTYLGLNYFLMELGTHDLT